MEPADDLAGGAPKSNRPREERSGTYRRRKLIGSFVSVTACVAFAVLAHIEFGIRLSTALVVAGFALVVLAFAGRLIGAAIRRRR